MNKQQQKWAQRLRKAWTSPNRNFVLWKTVNSILKDDTGDTDELTIELAKWVRELQN
jgi:hypothetical protein